METKSPTSPPPDLDSLAVQRAREAFDSGVYAALDLCRRARGGQESYNPFEAFEQRMILLALRTTEGNQLRAAELLGINRATLRKKMIKHAIRVDTRVIKTLVT